MKNTDPMGTVVETTFDVASAAAGAYAISQWDEETSTLDKGLDVGGLVLDVAAAATPFVPGGASLALKALRGAENAADVVTHVDEAVDAAKPAAKRVAEEVDKVCPGGKCASDVQGGMPVRRTRLDACLPTRRECGVQTRRAIGGGGVVAIDHNSTARLRPKPQTLLLAKPEANLPINKQQTVHPATKDDIRMARDAEKWKP